jgi:hypothetical protein
MTSLTNQLESTEEAVNDRLESLVEAAREEWDDLTDDELARLREAGSELTERIQSDMERSWVGRHAKSVMVGSLLLAIVAAIVIFLRDNSATSVRTS